MAVDPAIGVQYGRYTTERLGGKWTAEKARFFDAWTRAEGTAATYNPFATTRSGYVGESNLAGNSAKVKNYPSLEIGRQATFDTITKTPYYPNIVALLKDPNATAEDLAKAVADSPWGTGTGVLRVLGVTNADAYESSTKAAAKVNLISQQQQAIATENDGIISRLSKLMPSAQYASAVGKLGPLSRRSVETTTQLVGNLQARLQSQAEVQAQKYGGTTIPATDEAGFVATGPNSVVNRVLYVAQKQIGKPYVWGAESPAEGGFDCSGLIDYAYRQAGIDLPGRLTTYTAMNIGKSVKGQKYQPGDMIITNGGKHMVMYTGNGQVIASPRRGEVVQYQPLSRFDGDIVDVRRVVMPKLKSNKEKA